MVTLPLSSKWRYIGHVSLVKFTPNYDIWRACRLETHLDPARYFES